MENINEIIKAAKDLGIKLTNAEIGTQLCQCWIDRVQEAKMWWNLGNMARCQEMIDAANAYAI